MINLEIESQRIHYHVKGFQSVVQKFAEEFAQEVIKQSSCPFLYVGAETWFCDLFSMIFFVKNSIDSSSVEKYAKDGDVSSRS